MSDRVVARQLWKRYQLRHASLRDVAYDLWPPNRRRARALRRAFWALEDVTFDVQNGETFGVVGANGSGKSTLLKLMAGIMHPTRGHIDVGGRVALLSHLGSGFHPELSGRENVWLQGAVYGLSKSQLAPDLDAILAFAECEDFVDVPVKFYSSGMRLRLAFAIVTHLEPELLLIDEALAVGDTAFRDRCLERILTFHRGGTTMVIVSHERYLVEQLCSRAILLEKGTLTSEGSPADVFTAYEHAIQLQHQHDGTFANQGDSEQSPLRIDSVCILGHEHEPEPVVEADQSLTLRISLTAKRDVRNAIVAAQVAREWHVLHGTRCNRQGLEIDASQGDQVVIDLEYERLSLSRGSYLVHLLVFDHPLARQAVLRHKQAAQFKVTHSEREGVGLVRIPHAWSRVK